MADRYATKDGDWSDVSVWDGGASLPSAGDTVRPNGFDVVIDQDITVAILTNNASGSAAANGTFTLEADITVNADIEGRAAPNADFVVCNAGDQLVIGDVTAFVGSGWALKKATAGLLSITGNLTCGASNTSHSVMLQNTASLSVVGDLDSDGLSSSGNSSSVYSTSSGDISITGNVTGAWGAIFAIRPGVYSTGTGNLTVNGTVRGAVGGAYSYGIYCTGAVTVVHNGDSIAGGREAIGLTNTSSTYVHNGNAQSAPNGRKALDVRGYYLISSALSTTHTYRENNAGVAGDERILYTLNALPEDYTPAESDVRSGTDYNNGESTGTLIVPPVESVGVGVPVDDTVGTGVISAEGLLDLITAATGPYEVDITVSDGSPVANATCVLKSGSQVKARGTTDANGNPDPPLYAIDGTYTLITYSDGHITKSQTVEVDGDDVTVAVTLESNGVSAGGIEGLVRATIKTNDPTEQVQSGVTCYLQLVKHADGSTGLMGDTDPVAGVESDEVAGAIIWDYVRPGSTYQYWRESSDSLGTIRKHTIPLDASDPYPLPSWHGKD